MFARLLGTPVIFKKWLATLSKTFGFNFVMMLFFVQHILKGFTFGGGTAGWVGTPTSFLFRELGLTASKMQRLQAIASTPWSIKPVIGFISDLISINGYHKIPYMLLSTFFSGVSLLSLSFFWPMSENSVTLFLFFMYLQCSVCDLLSEAKYSQKLKEHPHEGPSLMSFVWGGIFLAQLISTATVGGIITYFGTNWVYLFSFFPSMSLVFPLIYNWLGESKSEKNASFFGFNFEVFHKQWKLFLLSTIMAFLSIAMIYVTLMDYSSSVAMLVSTISCVIILSSFWVLTPRTIAKAQAFFFLHNICAISIDSGSFYFFTDDEIQYPEGPHFSKLFYTTAIGIVTALFNLVGITLYNMYMKNWKYSTIFIMCNILSAVLSLLNVVVFLRLNKPLGIPDEIFVLGSDAFMSVVGIWAHIPAVVMYSQLCPDKVEATMYALLAGTSNFGRNLAAHQGAFIMDYLGIKPNGSPGESSQFDNLWFAALLSALLPLIPLLLVFRLIPDARQVDKIDIEGNKIEDSIIVLDDPV